MVDPPHSELRVKTVRPDLSPGASLGLSSAFLVAANLIPLVGAIFWDWSVADIVILYWIENVIVGIINVFRMAVLPNGKNKGFMLMEKGVTIIFFLIHYGIFTLVHGFFVFSLLGEGSGFNSLPGLLTGQLKWAVLALLASHLISFFLNFLGQKEYSETQLKEQMFAPYPRMLALHIAILAGAFAIEAAGQPLVLLIILVAGKTIVDLKLHLRSHRKKQLTEKE